MPLSDKYATLLACCRPDGSDQGDRRLRETIHHAMDDPVLREAFARQAEFDGQLAPLVQAVPLPLSFEAEVQAGVQRAVRPRGGSWGGLFRQPAAWAVLLAFLFLAGWGAEAYHEHSLGFTGDDTVREMIEYSRRGPHADHIQPLSTECDLLGDTLFLQYGLEDYAVPSPFTHAQVAGYRVFAKKEHLVAQIKVNEQDMTFLVFRADQQGVNIVPPSRWKFLDGTGWTAAVTVRRKIGFAAIYQGDPAAAREYFDGARKKKNTTVKTGLAKKDNQ